MLLFCTPSMLAYSSMIHPVLSSFSSFFFFNDTATTEIYTLSLHDALPISSGTSWTLTPAQSLAEVVCSRPAVALHIDRKSTRLNSSHEWISYAVFCLKKKKRTLTEQSDERSYKQVVTGIRKSDDDGSTTQH